MKPKFEMKFNGLDKHLKELSKPGSKATHDIVKEMIDDALFEIECEKCSEKIKVPIGKSKCPHCQAEITFILK